MGQAHAWHVRPLRGGEWARVSWGQKARAASHAQQAKEHCRRHLWCEAPELKLRPANARVLAGHQDDRPLGQTGASAGGLNATT